MSILDEVIGLIRDVLVLGDRADGFSESTGLMGSVPEFDSVAVVSLITEVEEEYGCIIEDDEINAEIFETVGSFARFVESKLA